MRITGPLTLEQQQQLDLLRTLKYRRLRELFASLDPPPIRSLDGEYDAELLNQGGKTVGNITHAAFSLSGPWTGKAFRPISERRGVGYNCYQYGNERVFKLPMRTEIGKSRLDNKPSLLIKYSELNSGIIRWLVGELRELAPTVIIGFGTFGPSFGGLDKLSRKIPFVMIGPRRRYEIELLRLHLPAKALKEIDFVAK